MRQYSHDETCNKYQNHKRRIETIAIVLSHTTTIDAYNDMMSLCSDNVGLYVDDVDDE